MLARRAGTDGMVCGAAMQAARNSQVTRVGSFKKKPAFRRASTSGKGLLLHTSKDDKSRTSRGDTDAETPSNDLSAAGMWDILLGRRRLARSA